MNLGELVFPDGRFPDFLNESVQSDFAFIQQSIPAALEDFSFSQPLVSPRVFSDLSANARALLHLNKPFIGVNLGTYFWLYGIVTLLALAHRFPADFRSSIAGRPFTLNSQSIFNSSATQGDLLADFNDYLAIKIDDGFDALRNGIFRESLRIVWAHEYAHVVMGHLHYLANRDRDPAAELREVSLPLVATAARDPLPDRIRRVLEADADQGAGILWSLSRGAIPSPDDRLVNSMIGMAVVTAAWSAERAHSLASQSSYPSPLARYMMFQQAFRMRVRSEGALQDLDSDQSIADAQVGSFAFLARVAEFFPDLAVFSELSEPENRDNIRAELEDILNDRKAVARDLERFRFIDVDERGYFSDMLT